MDIDNVERGDRVRIEAVGTVVHVHGNGRVDIQWDDSPVENSVDVHLVTKLDDIVACSVPGHPEGRLSEDGKTFYCPGCDSVFDVD